MQRELGVNIYDINNKNSILPSRVVKSGRIFHIITDIGRKSAEAPKPFLQTRRAIK